MFPAPFLLNWFKTKAIKDIFLALSKKGGNVYAVGGCVRNAAMGKTVSDVDLAVDFPPAQVIELLNELNTKIITN